VNSGPIPRLSPHSGFELGPTDDENYWCTYMDVGRVRGDAVDQALGFLLDLRT